MLDSVRHLRRFNVAAVDGMIGTIRDVLFDTSSWCIRYLFVATGRWVPCRTVLISLIDVDRIDRAGQSVTLAVTHERVRHSPRIAMHRQVSRADEIANAQHFGHRPYWSGGALWGASADPAALRSREPAMIAAGAANPTTSAGGTVIHSASEIEGYRLAGVGSPLGRIADLLVEEPSWVIRYIVVIVGAWPLSRRLLIPPSWVVHIDTMARGITADVDCRLARRAPRFGACAAVDRRWEVMYYAHFRRPGYWTSGG
jgi:hypothetical protein